MKLTDITRPKMARSNVELVLHDVMREFEYPHYEIVSWDSSSNTVTLNINAPVEATKIVTINKNVPFEVHLHRVDSFYARSGDFRRIPNFPQSLFEYFPSVIQDSLAITTTEHCSLHGMYKYVKRIINNDSSIMVDSTKPPTHLLGLLLIKGNFLLIDPNYNRSFIKIINRHLSSDRDINACQEELIEAGFPEQAKL